MTYQNDPNINRRPQSPLNEDRSYTGWIIGAVLTLAVIFGVFAMMNRSDTNTASNNTNTPTTTGSAANVPASNRGDGTAGAPRQDPPAKPR